MSIIINYDHAYQWRIYNGACDPLTFSLLIVILSKHVAYFSCSCYTYRIMQIARGGKDSRFHELLVIRTGKLLRLYSNSKHVIIKKKKFAGNLRDRRLIHENSESFPLRTICIIRYMNNLKVVAMLCSHEFIFRAGHLLLAV